MSETPSFLPRLFAEMKRRKVFRVMAVYGVIGFGIIEAAEAIFPRVALPDWTVTLVVWLTLLANLAAAGRPIGPHDQWLAATCLAHGLTLATANLREFERVEGLTIENWAADG